MHGRFIRNRPLAQKVLIAPALLLVVIVALGGHIQRTIALYDDALRAMDVEVHRKGSLVDGVVIDVGVVQGRLYQFINWQSAGLGEARLQELAGRIGTGLPRIAAGLSALDGLTGLSDAERDALRTATGEADAYVKAVAQVLEMALVDQSYAVMFMKAVDDGHARLAGTLRDLQERAAARSAEIFDGVRAESARALLVSVGAIVLSLALGVAVALLVAGMISRPIGAMTGAMQALSRGDLDARVDFGDRRDEIGRMAGALAVFQRAMRENATLQDRQRAEAEAREDRRRTLDDATDRFAATMDRLTRDVGALAEDMRGSAETMSCAAGQATGLSLQVSTETGRASANVTAVASATEELSVSIAEITRQVRESAALSRGAVDLARESAAMVRTLADSAGRIGSIIELISAIAGQTNLLALNATIEAARAGAAGKGFAVVAGEVKALARQTEHATDEITRQIASVQADAGGVIGAIASIDQTIRRMNGIAETVAVSIEEQMAATQAISRNAQDISCSVSQVAENIRRVEESTRSTGAFSDHVLDATNRLAGRFDELRTRVRAFVEEVHGGRHAHG